MTDITSILQNIYAYIKNPTCHRDEDLSLKEKGVLMLVILGLSFAINFFFILLIGGLEQLGLFSMEEHAINKMFEELSPILIIIAAVLVAPLLEELIFRAPITLFCGYEKAFKWIFYGFAILFGYVHISNYELTTNVLLISPILVAPQIILGLFLGLIRVRLGLIYAILFHAVYNAILVIPGVLFYAPEV